MGDWELEIIQKRIRQHYRNRFLYLASLLIFLVFFLLTLSDPNMRDWGWIMLVWPIAHTAYLLYLEFSERAIEQTLQQRKKNIENDEVNRYADDEEDQQPAIQYPSAKRKRSGSH
jgi:hypothetical protein